MENNLILSDLRQLCYEAHRNTSFSPEKRADQYVKEYSELLEEDLKLLGENSGNYKEKFIEKFKEWMRAKSNCISSMITGGSNFPVARAEKANRSEHAKSEEFFKWREKYFTAVNRVKTPSPEEDLDNAMQKLDNLLILQERMKTANKIIRKHGTGEKCVEELVKEGFSEKMISSLQQPDHAGRFGFPSFSLTNNNAKIKSTREKIETMRNRIEVKHTFNGIEFTGGTVQIEDDRVKIFHDAKPDQNVIEELKNSGFRWSPFWKCWCRKHTENAMRVTQNLSFIKQN